MNQQERHEILEALNYASDNVILNFADILKQVEKMKNEQYLKNHKYKIWQGENDKKWYTYLPDAESERKKKLVKRTTEKAIKQAVIDFYRKKETEEKIDTFKDAYFLWRSKHDETVSENTVAKYDSDYRRYFSGTEFEKIRLKQMQDDDIKVFMVKSITREELNRESSRKLLSYIKNAIGTARKYKAVIYDPSEFIEAKDFYRHCTEKAKTIDDEIMSFEELEKLQIQLKKDHEKKPDYIPSYAVEMAMFTGMRVAEVSALKWEKITEDFILIDSSEKANPQKDTFYIGKTKTGKSRKFPIDDNIQAILDAMRSIQKEYGFESEYVFANKQGRIHGKTISACIKTKCRQAKIKERGIYALRKTFNSVLRCNGVSAVTASQLLGHTVETNNKYYTFDNTNMAEKNKIVSEANSRLKVTQGNTFVNASNF